MFYIKNIVCKCFDRSSGDNEKNDNPKFCNHSKGYNNCEVSLFSIATIYNENMLFKGIYGEI